MRRDDVLGDLRVGPFKMVGEGTHPPKPTGASALHLPTGASALHLPTGARSTALRASCRRSICRRGPV